MTIKMTAAQFATLESRISAAHAATMTSTTSPNDGVITGHGVTARFSFAPDMCLLSIELKHHPFWMSCAETEKAIAANIAAAIA